MTDKMCKYKIIPKILIQYYGINELKNPFVFALQLKLLIAML